MCGVAPMGAFTMADPKGPFVYTYKWWDKNRPGTLPSTGLGEELKKYETARNAFENNHEIATYLAAKAALTKVEEAREKAIRKCGSLHKAIKRILEAADGNDELHGLKELLRKPLKELADKILAKMRDGAEVMEKRATTIGRALEDVRNKKASPDQMQMLKIFARSDAHVLRIGYGELTDRKESLDRAAGVLARDFPEIAEYQRESRELRDLIDQHTRDYLGMQGDAKTVTNQE
jgi:hypothetical protein